MLDKHGIDMGLIEMGSNSLKYYHIFSTSTGGPPSIETSKAPWRVAHEYYQKGAIDQATLDNMIEFIKRIEVMTPHLPVSQMMALATGVFREIDDLQAITARIKDETGVRVRVISGPDEAKLMARSFLKDSLYGASVLLADLGGATMEWAWCPGGKLDSCGSLSLGAIRNQYAVEADPGDPDRYVRAAADYCDEKLADFSLQRAEHILVTGGTAKAAAKCLASKTMSIAQLSDLVQRVARNGPPEGLKPARKPVFLSGLIILWRLCLRCRAEGIVYSKASVKQGMAARLLRLLESVQPRDLHATLLLRSTRISKPAYTDRDK